MLGRISRDRLARNRSYQEVAMTAITQGTIIQYWDEHHEWQSDLIMGLSLLAIGAIALLVGWHQQWASVFMGGMVAAFFGAMISLKPAMGDYKIQVERANSPEYKLLDRWVRYSYFSAKDFPTTEVAFKVLVEWAKDQLCSRAKTLNAAYAEQEAYQRKVEQVYGTATNPKEIRSTTNALRHEGEWIKIRVERAKEEYLGLWDLVAEGKQDSVGILKGPEWQGPEAFRQKILKEVQDGQI
jgi:hypothetical protein